LPRSAGVIASKGNSNAEWWNKHNSNDSHNVINLNSTLNTTSDDDEDDDNDGNSLTYMTRERKQFAGIKR